jgi:hypothetical protein
VIRGGRYHVTARVPVCRHGTRQIDPVHQASAEQSAQRIRVVGQNQFRHLELGFAHGTRRQHISFVHGNFQQAL